MPMTNQGNMAQFLKITRYFSAEFETTRINHGHSQRCASSSRVQQQQHPYYIILSLTDHTTMAPDQSGQCGNHCASQVN